MVGAPRERPRPRPPGMAPGPAPDRGACASPAARPGWARGRWRLGVASAWCWFFLFLFRRRARAGLPARGAAPLVAHFGRAWRGRTVPLPAARATGAGGVGAVTWADRRPLSPGPRDEGPGVGWVGDSRRSQACLRPPGARRWAFGFCFLSGRASSVSPFSADNCRVCPDLAAAETPAGASSLHPLFVPGPAP